MFRSDNPAWKLTSNRCVAIGVLRHRGEGGRGLSKILTFCKKTAPRAQNKKVPVKDFFL